MSADAEKSIIGCMVLDTDCAKEAVDRLSPEMFSNALYKKIFDVACDYYWEGKKIDYVTLAEKLPDYKTDLVAFAEFVPRIGHIDEYITIVINDWRRSSLKQSLYSAIEEVDFRTPEETTEFLQTVIQKQSEIFKFDNGTGISFREATENFVDWLQSKKDEDNINCGYRYLESATGGFMRQSVSVLSARSGHGKTDFALNLAIGMAKKGHKVLYFSLEMPTNQLMQRIASQFMQIDGTRIRDRTLTADEVQQTKVALSAFKNAGKVNFVDDAKVSTKDVRHYIDLYKPDAVFIDHLGLMERPTMKDQYRALGMVCHELKQIAKEENIAIVELVQMNRLVEGRKDKTPNLGDLRESGDIEQDADYVMFVQSEQSEKPISGNAWLDTNIYLQKNRNGRTGTFQFHWQPQYHTYYEVENRYAE